MWKAFQSVRLVVAITVLVCIGTPRAAQSVGVPRLPLVAADSPKPLPTKDACLRLIVGNARCSATCVATSQGKSLVISCNHCFAHQRFPGAPFPRANYPLACKLQTLDGGKTYDGLAIDGSPSPDCAIIVVNDTISACGLGISAVPPGTACEHWGISSVHATGTVLKDDTGGGAYPNGSFQARISSIPGDSGAGIFADGKLVAVNWGYYSRQQEGGSSIVPILRYASGSTALQTGYPELRGAIPTLPPVSGVPTPPSGPVQIIRPECPPGGCPINRPLWRRLPILRRF